MPDYILLMHNDAVAEVPDPEWQVYFARLRNGGSFQGGSAIGGGRCARKHGAIPSISAHIGGYIRINAANLDEAGRLIAGNPVFEAGGTVEIRELSVSE
jgi:hypothetical protein